MKYKVFLTRVSVLPRYNRHPFPCCAGEVRATLVHVHPGHVVLQPHPVLAGSHGDESAARPERPGPCAQVQEEREERGRMLLRRRLRHHHLHHAAGSALPRPASPADLQVSDCMIIPVCPWICLTAQELCESRGGRPGLPSLISPRFLWT